MPQQLSPELENQIEAEARNYAWRNYVSASQNPQAEFENINTWPDEACYSYYSLLYYLKGDSPAQPVQGIFSAAKFEDTNRRLKEALDLLSPLLDYGLSKEANIQLGASITAVILERAKRYERSKKIVEEIVRFVRDLTVSWDCDSDSHRYNTLCRKCEAKRLYELCTWTAIGEADNKQNF